ncbi:MAG: VCBS repeat-containing protein [Planctomycetes bacterium]|nr:VCBS repeat-containing protein [Planctomycetota bacterium]
MECPTTLRLGVPICALTLALAGQAEPLRAPRGGDGPKFLRLAPEACGVDFVHELRPEHRFQYLTNGCGLAVGDCDGDGLPDLYLISQDGKNRLFRQVEPLRFVDATATAGGVDGGDAWGAGATFVDVDGDGDLDLYVCNVESKNLLYVNQGDGTFLERAADFGLDLVAASMMAAFCDYDRDGDLDCYLLTNRALHASWAQTPEVLDAIKPPAAVGKTARDLVPTLPDLATLGALERGGKLTSDDALPSHLRPHFLTFRGKAFMAGQPDRLLRQDDGRFVDVTERSGIQDFGMGLSATWWDFDADGLPDLYVANDLESPDILWRNLGNGRFENVTADVLPHTAYYGMGSDAADVDNDGRLDLFVADMSATTHKKAKILMGDMNRQRDFLIFARPQQYMRNALLLNTGMGRFQEAAMLAGVASTDWTWSTLFGDLDNDGRQDLFVTNGISRFDMNPDLQMQVEALTRRDRHDEAVAVIKSIPAVPERNLALRQESDLRFVKTGADWGLDLEAVSHGAALVDLDRDGDLDVVTMNFTAPIGIWENRTTGHHAIAFALRGQGKNPFAIGARVSVELPGARLLRENWLSRGYLSGQEPRLHFGLGSHTGPIRATVRWPSGRTQEFADLAVDHLHTLVEPQAPGPISETRVLLAPALRPQANGPAATHREMLFDDFADQPLLPARLSQLGPGVAFGDADGDGDEDLFVGGAKGQPGTLCLRDGTGWKTVDGPWQADADAEDLGVLWLDYDSDTDLDLLVVSGGVESPAGDPRQRDRLYRNEAHRFVRDDDALPADGDSGSCAVAADFDRDGDLDLCLGGRCIPGRYPDAPGSRLLRNDGGRFVDVTAELAPALRAAGMVTSALWTDVDADGFVDLLVAAHWQPIRLLRNDGGKRLVDATAAAGLADATGWWNSLCAIDVDDDGDLDYVAGNQGKNSKYKADPEHPATLWYDDFDGNGTRDLIEAKYEGDRLLPVRGRSCSSQAMPFLADKFPTYERFASAVLGDIYQQDKLGKAGKLHATTLANSLLRNDGNGHFTIEPLPHRAQIAPIFGMAVIDGNLLVAAQNSFSPEPETGHHDGGTGLVLRAVGGNLVVVPPDEHGLVLGGDMKGLALGELPNEPQPVIAIARNDDRVATFSVTRSEPAPAPAVVGHPGNPTAIGARLVFEFADGRKRATERHAGSGYLSQSTVQLTMPGAIAVQITLPDGRSSRQELPH